MPPNASATAWILLGGVSLYYLAICIFVRLGVPVVRRTIVQYDPPEGISPSLAACLWRPGAYERALAAGIISLAEQGFIAIQEVGEQFKLQKLKESDTSLPAEESSLLGLLFSKSASDCEFGGIDPGSLRDVLANFRDILDDLAYPKFMSSHEVAWWLGVAYSSISVPLLAALSVSWPKDVSWFYAYLTIWIALGISSLIASLRVWPVTLGKVASWVPGSGLPASRLNASDATPLFLTFSALVGFTLLGALSSPDFAMLIAAVVLVNFVFRRMLEAPTGEGRKAISQLRGFREFLSRADGDRLSRADGLGGTTRHPQKDTGFAAALDVGRGWGEQFTLQLIEALEFDRAYSPLGAPSMSRPIVKPSRFVELNLRGRK